MPRTKLDECLPDPSAVAKLIERYIKIERRITVDETVTKVGTSMTSYYRRMKDPGNFTLAELRQFGKTLKIPQEELSAALVKAIRY